MAHKTNIWYTIHIHFTLQRQGLNNTAREELYDIGNFQIVIFKPILTTT